MDNATLHNRQSKVDVGRENIEFVINQGYLPSLILRWPN